MHRFTMSHMKARVSRTIRTAVLACSVVSAVPSSGDAQVAYDSPKGRVEILGLRRWTLKMLQDSIGHYVRGQELHDAACIVTLRDSLHFADASVEELEWAPPGQPVRSYLTIKVIEPQQGARVQWDLRPRQEFTSLLQEYAALILPVTETAGGVWRGRILNWLQFSDTVRLQRVIAAAPPSARADAERAIEFRRSRRSEADRERAMRVLAHDGFWANRMAAVAVLSNFAQHDSTWWTLARALRDPHEGVREMAAVIIRTLPPRPIDWRPVSKDLRLLVGGTNLPAMREVFSVLVNTSIAPDMAPILLRDNADWVLDHLASETPMASDAAHRLLVSLNGGRDRGPTRLAWSAWIRSLRSRRS